MVQVPESFGYCCFFLAGERDVALLTEAFVEQSPLLEVCHHLLDPSLDCILFGIDDDSGCSGS